MTDDTLRAALPPGPYEVRWPAEQGGAFTIWGKQGTPPDFTDGWAIPLVASGVEGPMRAICDMLNAALAASATDEGPRQARIEAAIADISEEWAESAEWLARTIVANMRDADPQDAGLQVDNQRPAVPEALDWWTPQHLPACAMQDDDADCICGVGPEYERLLALAASAPDEGPAATCCENGNFGDGHDCLKSEGRPAAAPALCSGCGHEAHDDECMAAPVGEGEPCGCEYRPTAAPALDERIRQDTLDGMPPEKADEYKARILAMRAKTPDRDSTPLIDPGLTAKTPDPATERPVRRSRAPGCATCDRDPGRRQMMPPHDASERCESGKHPHCSCDTCF